MTQGKSKNEMEKAAASAHNHQTRMPLALCRALSCTHMFKVQHAVFQSPNSNLQLFHSVVTGGGAAQGSHKFLSQGSYRFPSQGSHRFLSQGSHRFLSQGVTQVSFSGWLNFSRGNTSFFVINNFCC